MASINNITDAGIKELISKIKTALKNKADKSVTYSVIFTADGWTGDVAPYTQSVTVSGVTADTKLIGIPDTRECVDATAESAMKKAYGYLTYFETGVNTVTATAKFEKPTVDISVIFEGV